MRHFTGTLSRDGRTLGDVVGEIKSRVETWEVPVSILFPAPWWERTMNLGTRIKGDLRPGDGPNAYAPRSEDCGELFRLDINGGPAMMVLARKVEMPRPGGIPRMHFEGMGEVAISAGPGLISKGRNP